jgi:hypothetical protein
MIDKKKFHGTTDGDKNGDCQLKRKRNKLIGHKWKFLLLFKYSSLL